MPRSNVDDPRTFKRIQGIDIRDDADANSLSDAVNVEIDSAGRLSRPDGPTRLSGQSGTEAAPATPAIQGAAYMADQNGNEVTIDISSVSSSTVTAASVSTGSLVITGTGLQYVEKVLVMAHETPYRCYMSGVDFAVTPATAGTSFTCSSGLTAIAGDHVIVWCPTQVLYIIIAGHA
jgi:hypothetical protein